ncbi:Receptor L-domain domain-containing protein [Caenorhabditis elegans]|uniref:Receptor L-domain domain-containing protein n=1 Tax=Caenorhabditis elegans TaxID=6239 RepID=H2L0E3_CAEEL|nr:Receptor L-domain domain-containing protein [Caenorhabditis elegans]CCD72646.1 Receptor L-domain domain-containing protein [Caenorhabditis elegans]|eukprot:NP_001024029.1 Insulin/EGF-Receptor L Domain protein [Caenorhabditis elegans]
MQPKVLFFCNFIFYVSTENSELSDACEEKCQFKDETITSSSIKNWPTTCESVCGNLYLTSETDLSENQLKETFGNLKYLIGSLKVVHTNITSLSVLPKLQTYYCDEEGLIIAHNPMLTDIKIMEYWYPEVRPCILHIYNNSKLDSTHLCENFYVIQQDLDVYGNARDCGCSNVRLHPSSLPFYRNCTRITGGLRGVLKISEVSDQTDLSALSNLKSITGNLEVYNTELQNLSFFKNLQTINGQLFQEFSITSIHDNPKLTRLGLDSLTTLIPMEKGFSIAIANNHPDFCVSTSEFQLFTKVGFHTEQFEATVCRNLERNDGQKVCYLEKLSTLDSNCQHIIGDVIINNDNENDVETLEDTIMIYGSLTIEHTANLKDLGFFKNLEQVGTLSKSLGFNDKAPVIRFLSNEQLQNLTFPRMRYASFSVFSLEKQGFVEISDNSQTLFQHRNDCMQYQTRLKSSEIKYNGHSCLQLEPALDSPAVERSARCEIVIISILVSCLVQIFSF